MLSKSIHTYVPRNGQNCSNSVRSLSLAGVQPIVTILGLKKTGRAYFVTFGALVIIITITITISTTHATTYTFTITSTSTVTVSLISLAPTTQIYI